MGTKMAQMGNLAQTIETMDSVGLALADMDELKRTQPATYESIIAYGAARAAGDQAAAFKHMGDIAAHILALAAGLKVGA